MHISQLVCVVYFGIIALLNFLHINRKHLQDFSVWPNSLNFNQVKFSKCLGLILDPYPLHLLFFFSEKYMLKLLFICKWDQLNRQHSVRLSTNENDKCLPSQTSLYRTVYQFLCTVAMAQLDRSIQGLINQGRLLQV